MELHANQGKSVMVRVGGKLYARYAIQTHFIREGENYLQLLRQYVLPFYQPGDIISCSEKVIALCQCRIVTEEEVKPGWWAGFLCRFVRQTSAGPGMGLPQKMQFAINHCGLGRVLWAAFRAALDRARGKRGTFYKLLGSEVAGLDGFYGREIEEYAHIGIRIPSHPDRVCNQVLAETGMNMMIVDANDLNVEILGTPTSLMIPEWELKALIKDNPAGQGRKLTPFILIRPLADTTEDSICCTRLEKGGEYEDAESI